MAPEQLLRELFNTAVLAAKPEAVLAQYLPEPPAGRTVVIGAGKAAGSMVAALEQHWPGEIEGLVVTPYGHAVESQHISIVEAAHPVPDAAGLEAAKCILQLVQGLTADDLVLCLISGGGSSLLALPGEGLSIADKQQVNRALLKSGATISEMNCVRKHLSGIKGGRLARACAPAKVVNLMISDVPGDDESVIASGPTVADPTTYADAAAILDKYQITEPIAARQFIDAAADETPKPGADELPEIETRMIATPQMALQAAADKAQELGVTPMILSDRIEGEARDCALMHAAIAQQIITHQQPLAAPCVLLSGGETTVSVKGNGRGGRNAEFLLALTIALQSNQRVYALACDTDGIDGMEDNAGAISTPASLERAQQQGVNPKALLNNNDSYSFFEALDDLIITGPTLTNVNDFRAILVV